MVPLGGVEARSRAHSAMLEPLEEWELLRQSEKKGQLEVTSSEDSESVGKCRK